MSLKKENNFLKGLNKIVFIGNLTSSIFEEIK